MIMIFPMVIPSPQLPIVLLHTNIVSPAQLRVTGPGAGDCGGEGAGSHGPIDTPGWAGPRVRDTVVGCNWCCKQSIGFHNHEEGS